MVTPKPVIVPVVPPAEVDKDVQFFEDYFIINGKAVPLDAAAKFRFWVNLERVRAEKSLSIEDLLKRVEMPRRYFDRLRGFLEELRPLQVRRFALVLEVSVLSLLG